MTSKKKSTKKKDAEELAPEGVVPPEEHVVDPANTGPATSHPEASTSGGHNPETAVPERRERDRRAGK